MNNTIVVKQTPQTNEKNVIATHTGAFRHMILMAALIFSLGLNLKSGMIHFLFLFPAGPALYRRSTLPFRKDHFL